jgi:transcriptional regulator with XRE-family HTH domain
VVLGHTKCGALKGGLDAPQIEGLGMDNLNHLIYHFESCIHEIIKEGEERKWSLYDLATHAELKSSTISTWYNDNAIPTIPSLVKICDAFQITLSEFFAKAEGSESVPVALTPQQMQVIEKWSILRPDQQEAFLNLLNTIP